MLRDKKTKPILTAVTPQTLLIVVVRGSTPEQFMVFADTSRVFFAPVQERERACSIVTVSAVGVYTYTQ